uniref:Uncharacterized protein n=1 Tax=Arundo donax TaxID=35708 RepID=A0A0A9EMX5_ARUDO
MRSGHHNFLTLLMTEFRYNSRRSASAFPFMARFVSPRVVVTVR